VPSIRRWKLASLPTYLSAVQVQAVVDGCDRATTLGRRDYAILMMLAKLGMRAGEVATLTLDDIDWRSGEMLICGKGRQRARMPIPPDVGAAVVHDGRPKSSCRRRGEGLLEFRVHQYWIYALLREHGRDPHRIIHAQTDEPAVEQIVMQLLL
jgi:integrase